MCVRIYIYICIYRGCIYVYTAVAVVVTPICILLLYTVGRRPIDGQFPDSVFTTVVASSLRIHVYQGKGRTGVVGGD